MSDSQIPKLVTEKVIAEIFGVSLTSIQRGRRGLGEFATMPFYRAGKSCRYLVEECLQWARERGESLDRGV